MGVLITDGEQRSVLAAVRSLGRARRRVLVAASRHPCLAGASRYCSAALTCPPAESAPQTFAHAIARVALAQRARLIIPASDAATLALSLHRHLLPEWAALPLPDHESLLTATDRLELLHLGAQLQVPCPVTWSQDAAPAAYPAVIKPRAGIFDSAGIWRKPSPVIVRSRVEAAQVCSAYASMGLQAMIQEHIPGQGYGVFALCDHGEPCAVFAHRRLREKPPEGGVSVLRESAPLLPELVQPALRLLRALRWHGVAMVEFRRDSRDGRFKLMEINPRIWGSLQLAIDAGVDFPLMLYDLIVDGRRPRPIAYRVGLRSRWLMGDLDHLLISLRRADGAAVYALSGFLRFWDGRFEIERLHDPVPALLEKVNYACDLLHVFRIRLPGRAAARSAEPVWG